ncbi:MAG: hypothetical protein LBN10_01000 [Propionibacteriaceae bacterium]|nr:hypothetical protein [Propionibacteriaceae bacterium]
MLAGIDPILTGRLLCALDEMGHGDMVVVADAHFTGSKLARKHLVDLPGLSSPRVLQAIRTVFVPDGFEAFQLGLMQGPNQGLLPVQEELIAAAHLDAPLVTSSETREDPARDQVTLLDRYPFYERAARAELIIRTGETRVYGNALFFKGVTPVPSDQALPPPASSFQTKQG